MAIVTHGKYSCFCSKPSIGDFPSDTIAGRFLVSLCADHAPKPAPIMPSLAEVVTASRALLNRIDCITTTEFQRGGEREEREALRLILDQFTAPDLSLFTAKEGI